MTELKKTGNEGSAGGRCAMPDSRLSLGMLSRLQMSHRDLPAFAFIQDQKGGGGQRLYGNQRPKNRHQQLPVREVAAGQNEKDKSEKPAHPQNPADQANC